MFYADKADEVLKALPGATQEEVLKSATELASDRFIVLQLPGNGPICIPNQRQTGLPLPVLETKAGHDRQNGQR
jgi:hypothetical protein